MTVGTKSLLVGVHQVLIHPWFVARAWRRLYGWPWDPRIWIAFFVHDLGYLGSPNMDGDEGERHPMLGARIMGWMFGPRWFDFALYHSRFFVRRVNAEGGAVRPSRLCYADKLAIVVTPKWLYLALARASGEIHEYMRHGADPSGKYAGEKQSGASVDDWYNSMTVFVRRWVEDHYREATI